MNSKHNLPIDDTLPVIDHEKSHHRVSFQPTTTTTTTQRITEKRSSKFFRRLSKVSKMERHHDVSSPYNKSFRDLRLFKIGQLLAVRKALLIRLAGVSHIMNFLSILGIILMIIENELTFHNGMDIDTEVSWYIKSVITISTVLLLGFIIWYHYLDLKLHAFHNPYEYWYVVLTNKKILLIVIELLICAIHPMPRTYSKFDSERENSNSTISYSYISVDVALGLPMFLRLYMISRSIVYHSNMFCNASLRSFGYINQVSINFFFLMKTYLEQNPTYCLFLVCITSFFIGSWSLRACNYKIDTVTREHQSIADAMWLFMMTSTTVGYGDISPTTYCGRAIASIIGIFGITISALIIAVIAQKLVLTREEKYLHNFAQNLNLNKKYREQAENVKKCAIKVWYLKRRGKYGFLKCFIAQRRLLNEIDLFRRIKKDQNSLVDNSIDMKELMTIQQNIDNHLDNLIKQMGIVNPEMILTNRRTTIV